VHSSEGVGSSTSGEAGGPTSSTGSEGEGSSTSDEAGSPTVVSTQREPEFRGSQPSGSSREEQPPRTVQRKLDFRGSQQAQREHHSSRGSLHSGTGGREESSK
jgi:hypothetical protein